MGRPILKICAMRGCEETDCTDPVHNAGVDFSVESCLAKDVSLSAESQLWACCPEHKEFTLQLVLDGMPYRDTQHKPELDD
ncbi:hypothetical protein ABBQ32_001813 [Trebouxia sp. C0010 RCD-2024]